MGHQHERDLVGAMLLRADLHRSFDAVLFACVAWVLLSLHYEFLSM